VDSNGCYLEMDNAKVVMLFYFVERLIKKQKPSSHLIHRRQTVTKWRKTDFLVLL